MGVNFYESYRIYLLHSLLRSSLESATAEVYKLRKVDGEKQKRINSFKMKLEGADQGVHGMIARKDEKIQSLEEKYVICLRFI